MARPRLRSSASSAALVGSVAFVAFVAPGCKPREGTPTPRGSVSGAAAGGSSAPSVAASASATAAPTMRRREGGALAKDASRDALWIADEDHRQLKRFALPLVAGQAPKAIDLPGAPAQVLSLGDRLLVTVRDPGLLLVFDVSAEEPKELARVALPADAWGLAVPPTGAYAVVTSAWTHMVSVVDLQTYRVRGHVSVAREPRGVVITPDGKRAFVSHLVGSSLTRLELGDALVATPVPLPAGPSRTPLGAVSGASLGYSLVIDPDRGRLFAPRHALGTVSRESQTGWEGGSAWFGSFAIDVLALADEQAIVPPRTAMGGVGYWASFPGMPKASTAASGTIPKSSWAEASSPRDSLFRRKTGTLLVASEGTDAVTEHDGWALDPSLVTAVRYPVGKGNDRMHGFAWNAEGAAPQGLALSEDEDTAWVLCRASYDVVAVKLVADPLQANRPKPAPPTALVRFAEDTLDKNGKEGRRVFYNATDTTTSGGLACAGCHPEGRDDGFVWRDARRIDTHDTPGSAAPPSDGHDLTADDFVFVGHPAALFRPENGGYPRQTPMLAGRIASPGPYGWHAQSKSLDARLAEGFRLHRWEPPTGAAADGASARILYLKAFLRVGLVPPPIDGAPLTERESLGKRIFESPETQCVTCHPPATEFTTRAAVPLRRPLPTRATFAKEADPLFKVPGLAFVGGTPPYYHDGSAPTLTALVEENGDRMGKTSHLSADERAALVAYLERL